jgi:hypothetical protein
VRDAGGDGDAAVMRSMGDGGMGAGDDNGAGGVTSLLPELDWKPRTLRLRLWIKNGEGRGGAHLYSPGPLVSVSNTIWD